VIPAGDKRLIQSWVDAITQYQSTQIQENKVATATIGFDAECYEGLTQPYIIVDDGQTVHRTVTYQMAVRYCKWHNLNIVDSQSLAQDELEAEMVAQATAAESAIQVLEQVEDEGCIKFIVQSGENFYTVT
ncbi:MAG: hypothetical protein ACKPE1_07340, partial [Dolichospermum sp.]